MVDRVVGRAEILGTIQTIACSVLGVPELTFTEESSARDVPGWDSLTHVQIIIGVEQSFGIRMTAAEVAQLENAASLIDVVQHHLASSGG